MRTLLILLSRPSNSMNCNGKRMKPEAIRLTKAQQCEIATKLSKRALGQEYEVNEGVIQASNLSMMKSSLSRHLLNLKVLQTSKALNLYTALSSTLTTNYFALIFKWKLDKCMMKCNDCLRHFSKTLTN